MNDANQICGSLLRLDTLAGLGGGGLLFRMRKSLPLIPSPHFSITNLDAIHYNQKTSEA